MTDSAGSDLTPPSSPPAAPLPAPQPVPAPRLPAPLPAESLGPVGYLAIVLAWMVPGLGHFMVGQKTRGLIFALTIHGLFVGGLLLGGIKALSPPEQPIWTYTQFLSGWPMLVFNKVARAKEAEIIQLKSDYQADRPEEWKSNPSPEEQAQVQAQRIAYGKKNLTQHPLLSYSPKIQDVGAVYCGIAGMLNLLVIFDLLLRVTGTPRDSGENKKSSSKGGAK